MKTIYLTTFNPETKQPTSVSLDSGFTSFDAVEFQHGEPLVRGKRTRTYAGLFFSDYKIKDDVVSFI